ncbi:glutamate--cysteine ligase [Streptomyces sp. NPDC007100]|uniref:glutamate--cysteine ligase 2 n=1 Tax=Streptomyces sp. NPDC007100 TaxID=3155602 RepID=UPI0033E3F86F
MRSVGVEEELLLVDPHSGEPRAVSGTVLAMAPDDSALEKELHREQLEIATRPTTLMEDLAAEVARWRGEAAHRARVAGTELVALATSPLPVTPSLSVDERYERLQEEFGLTAQEQLTCGCHIHVSVESDDEGVAVLDRIRAWLPALLALSANSPFWQGKDSCYSSYRSRVWNRWPSAGPVEPFGCAADYHRQVGALLATETLLDEGMIYFDARLSRRYPTVEIRVADVCLQPDDTVLLAALTRGLVETAARAWRAGEPPDPAGVGLLRLASWRAGRSGLSGRLVHPLTWTPAPAEAVVRALLDHVTEALEDTGDLVLAKERLDTLMDRGNGARVQREQLRRTGDLRSVVEECIRRTAP